MANKQGMVMHTDGYKNMLNKYGTKQDNSTAYEWQGEIFADDMQLVSLYEGNGLFAKIIDIPAEEAVKHGLNIDYGSDDTKEYVEDVLDELDYEGKFATAIKWARLFGGSIIVMLVNDGGTLEQPLNWQNVKSIEDLLVFERAVCEPEYLGLNQWNIKDSIAGNIKIGEPQYYNVFSMYGTFRVHASRCLVFRNGKMPEHTSNSNYRYWGIPEYVRLKKALRECITSHGYGTKMLEKSVQAIYKMQGLSNTLSSEEGEDNVVRRLEMIDLARGILNSIAIDADGEDYDFKNMQLSGVKDILDATCNMLSAVTDIPQTRLFGSSPSGMNSTGESDQENFYNMIERVQKQNMKRNLRTLIDLILAQAMTKHEIDEIPKYKVEFMSLWSLSEREQAEVDKIHADILQVKASTAQTYIDAGVLDASEVRAQLAQEGDFDIEDVLEDEDLDLPPDIMNLATDIEQSIEESIETLRMDSDDTLNVSESETNKSTSENRKTEGTVANVMNRLTQAITEIADLSKPKDIDKGVGLIVVKDGMILVGDRKDGDGISGPGGHMKQDEQPSDAVKREALEEFCIEPLTLIPLGELKGSTGLYEDSTIYLTDKYKGNPICDGVEMTKARWVPYEELQNMNLYPPFAESLKLLSKILMGDTILTE